MSHAHSSPSLALPPLVFLLALFVLPCHAGQVFGVAIAGKALSGSPAALVEEGTVLGPLAEAARLAGASAVWSPTHASVTVTSAEGRRILLSAGKTQMLVDGKEVELRKAPQVQSGVLVGPLSPLLQALGLRVHWTPGKSYMTANGLVKSVVVRAGAAGARIEVATSVPVTGSLVAPQALRGLAGSRARSCCGRDEAHLHGATGTDANRPARRQAELCTDCGGSEGEHAGTVDSGKRRAWWMPPPGQ